jgi:hypothetical protein
MSRYERLEARARFAHSLRLAVQAATALATCVVAAGAGALL